MLNKKIAIIKLNQSFKNVIWITYIKIMLNLFDIWYLKVPWWKYMIYLMILSMIYLKIFTNLIIILTNKLASLNK